MIYPNLMHTCIIDDFKKYNPKTVEEALLKTTWGFTCAGKGVFRAAYRVGHKLIAKFPITDAKPELNIKHSKQEMDNLKWIKRTKKFSILLEHLPDYFYWNSRTGVSLMPEYDLLINNLSPNTLALYDQLVKKLKLVDYGRVDKDQIGIKSDGTLVCMDFGHIGEQRRYWNREGRFCL